MIADGRLDTAATARARQEAPLQPASVAPYSPTAPSAAPSKRSGIRPYAPHSPKPCCGGTWMRHHLLAAVRDELAAPVPPSTAQHSTPHSPESGAASSRSRRINGRLTMAAETAARGQRTVGGVPARRRHPGSGENPCCARSMTFPSPSVTGRNARPGRRERLRQKQRRAQPCCACSRSAAGKIRFGGSRSAAARSARRCARSGGACRWCSRTPTPRSTLT